MLLDELNDEFNSINKQLTDKKDDQTLLTKQNLMAEAIYQHETILNNLQENQNTFEHNKELTDVIDELDKSYASDMEKINSSSEINYVQELIDRERLLQNKLNTALTSNDQRIAETNNQKLNAKSQLLEEAIGLSKERVNNLSQQLPENINETVYLKDFRNNNLADGESTLDKNAQSYEEASDLKNKFLDYENKLQNELSFKNQLLSTNPSNTKLSDEIAWLTNELTVTKNKIEQLNITIDSLKKTPINAGLLSQYNDVQLMDLEQRENEIQAALQDDGLSKKEVKGLKEELIVVSDKKYDRATELLKEDLKKNDISLAQNLKSINSASSSESGQVKNALREIEEANQASIEFENSANKAKNSEELLELTEAALVKKQEANELVRSALVKQTILKVQNENSVQLESLKDMEARKSDLQNQLSEINNEIIQIDYQISKASKKEAQKLNSDKQLLTDQKKSLQKEMDQLTSEIKDYQIKNEVSENSVISPLAKETAIDFLEEVNIAQTQNYAQFYNASVDAERLENEIRLLETAIENQQITIKNQIAANVKIEKTTDDETIANEIKELKSLETQLSQKSEAFEEIMKEVRLSTPKTLDESLKFQNMVARGVQPIAKQQLAKAVIDLPKEGITIDPDGVKVNGMLKDVPLDVKTPSGLVYRVQVGAFSKPIPEDLFKEFKPVTAEKIPNSSIIRYLAGYFNNVNAAIVARDQIRSLGYSDAFVIAYCDGKRISIAEAKQLEAKGECLARGENELLMELAANAAEKINIDTISLAASMDKYDYNKAVGAVKAEATEKYNGLYFTVQVGVFLHPVNAITVKEMPDIMTERLPNGTIRYSSGMFHSIDEAKPRKFEAIQKGISDAFITAYFKGKRISIQEAEALLKDKGKSILEPKIKEKEVVTKVIEPENIAEKIVNYSENFTDPHVKNKTKRFYQIISKKDYSEFPRDVLNRYNMKGNFYFDETERKVKSLIIESEDELPSVYYFQQDVDTVIIADTLVMNKNGVKIEVNAQKIPGELMDWLYRCNFRKEYIRKEDVIEIRIFELTDVKLAELEKKLLPCGLTYELLPNKK